MGKFLNCLFIQQELLNLYYTSIEQGAACLMVNKRDSCPPGI